MWHVQFRLEDKNPQGKVVFTQCIIEGEFENQGQAEAWLADGAKKRYGAVFWHRCSKITVIEGDKKVTMTQVAKPVFYAGGRYETK